MCAADARLAYQLFDAMNPFPCETVRANMPTAWKLSSALSSAASLHPSCVFVHMLILVALTLRAVMVRYSGLLGRYPNLVLIQHGAPGDGKSVAVWLCTQILMYYDTLRDKLAKK